MQYIKSSLTNSEKLVYAARPHWIVFSPVVFVFIMALLIAWYVPPYLVISKPAYYGMMGLACFTFIKAFIFYMTTEYGITSQRIIMKRGLIRRWSIEVFLHRIEGIHIDQTIMGRILNYGTVMIVGTGGTKDACFYVVNPLHFRQLAQQHMMS